jgi:hypothetical protein
MASTGQQQRTNEADPGPGPGSQFDSATGPGISRPVPIHAITTATALPPGSIPLRGEGSSKFWITDFDSFGGTEGLRYHRREFRLSDLFDPGDPSRGVLQRMDDAWDEFKTVNTLNPTEENTKFRWIHFADNNMDWVRKMLLDLRAYLTSELGTPQADRTSPLSTQDFFRQHTNSFGRSHFHARFMRPHCERWASRDQTQTELVLMMPYIHYDQVTSFWAMRELVELSQKSPSQEKLPHGSRPEDSLFFENLYRDRIQIRRSLDQSYYWTLKDTSRRDRDQVIDRYAEEHLGQREDERALLMVDQLWLWLLNEDRPESETAPRIALLLLTAL